MEYRERGRFTVRDSGSPTLEFDAMNGEPLRRLVTIVNPQGLHIRPISDFVKLASQFQSRVTVFKKDGNEPIDGRSPIGLLTLAAEQGTELTLEVSGPDQEAALEALVRLLAKMNYDEP